MTYNPKSCNALEKSFYTPIEAAIRWCGLLSHEVEIMEVMQRVPDVVPDVGMFPQWPCLRANAEKIYDALLNEEIPYGRDGRRVEDGDHVAPHRRTVRHADLKAWMAKNYPDQKPDFLFDEIEKGTHASITTESWHALTSERDALKVRVKNAEHEWLKLKSERDEWRKKYQDLAADVPDERPEKPSALLAIAGLLKLLLANDRKRYTQGTIAEAIDALGWRGASRASLNNLFASANFAADEAEKNAQAKAEGREQALSEQT